MQIKINDYEAYIIARELKNGIKILKEMANESRFLNKPDEVLHCTHLIAKYKELIKRMEQVEED